MDLVKWQAIITKHGGGDNVAKLIFDNGRVYTRDPGKTLAQEVTIDSANNTWEIKVAEQPYTINGKKIATTVVEANDSLQAIEFVDNKDDLKYVDQNY